jgi:hypothetical protein
MVSVREKIFLICGADFSQHKQALANIKKKILQGANSSLNTLTLYGKEVNIKTLQEELFLTSFDKSKVVIFKNFFELKAEAKDFIFNNLKRILTANYIICQTDKDYYQLQKNKRLISDKLFSFVFKSAALCRVTSGPKKFSIEDFMAGIRRNDLSFSLYVLESLFESGAKDKALGPQVIGILVKKFSYLKNSSEKNKAFQYLWEADRAIKEKGLAPRLVIETLLVKLFVPH